MCMQVKKQQLEPDMEQWTGSKLGKQCIKPVYCHTAYLTYMQSTSWEMLGWMKHKLDSGFPEEISIHPWVIFEANVWDALMGRVWIMCHFEFEVGYTRSLKCIQLWLFSHWSNIQTAVQWLKMNKVEAKRRPGFKRRAMCLLSGWTLANYLTPSDSLIHSL